MPRITGEDHYTLKITGKYLRCRSCGRLMEYPREEIIWSGWCMFGCAQSVDHLRIVETITRLRTIGRRWPVECEP